MTLPDRCDVVVVGAGPAGSVAARGLALAGFEVVLLERSILPRRKVCGGCLGPTAREALRRAGLAPVIDSLSGPPLDRMEIRVPGATATLSLNGLVALSRGAMDAALVESARRSGVHVEDGCRARIGRVSGEIVEVETPGGCVRAKIVVDASGLAGAVDPVAVPGAAVDPGSLIGIGAVFAPDTVGLTAGMLRMIAGRTGYVGLVRVEDGSVNVAAAVRPGAVASEGMDGAVATLLHEAGVPGFDAVPVVAWKGTPALTRRRATLARTRVFRVGDATGYVEPFTGEGMGWAVEAAARVVPWAAAGVTSWDDALAMGWSREQRRVSAGRQRLCRLLARGLRHERLARSVVRLLGRVPALASPLVRAAGRSPARPVTLPIRPETA